MKSAKLTDMVKGWFVGPFSPTAMHTDSCEVAVKFYRAGDREGAHFHKVATEVTLVLSGKIRMSGREWETGDIIVLSPGEATDFDALTDSVSVVVKIPGAMGDKYPAVDPASHESAPD